jgi:hypothetical protein
MVYSLRVKYQIPEESEGEKMIEEDIKNLKQEIYIVNRKLDKILNYLKPNRQHNDNLEKDIIADDILKDKPTQLKKKPTLPRKKKSKFWCSVCKKETDTLHIHADGKAREAFE